jgi:DNA-directed RNA polymerase subunit H (RpoH/RPB5)
MATDLGWIAYRNVCRMLEYRGHTLRDPPLSEKAYASGARVCEIVSNRLTILFIPDAGSDLYSKANLDSILATGKHVVVNMDVNKIAKRGPNVLHIAHFYVNWPAHVSTSAHRIASKEEATYLLTTLRIDATRLPKISVRDTACAWLGAVPGDIIASEHDSESAAINGETLQLVVI